MTVRVGREAEASSCFACGKLLQPTDPVNIVGYPGRARVLVRVHHACAVDLATELLTAVKSGATPQSSVRQVDAGVIDDLTPFEKRVLDGIVRGETNGQIARHLERKEKTVRNVVSNVLLKFGVYSRTEAAVKAVRAGIAQEQQSEIR